MKSHKKPCLLITAFLLSFAFVACTQWGYTGGPSYQLVSSNIVFIDTRLKKIISIDSVRKKLSVYCYDKDKVISQKILNNEYADKSSYILPDSVVAFSKINPLRVLLIIDDKRHFIIDLRPEDWIIKDTVYGLYKKFER